MCLTPTMAAPRASSRSSIWWRPGAASSWPGSKASSGRKPHDLEVGRRKPLEHPARELEVARAPRENDVAEVGAESQLLHHRRRDRKSTRLNSSHSQISYAVFCLKKKKKTPGCLLTLHA